MTAPDHLWGGMYNNGETKPQYFAEMSAPERIQKEVKYLK